MESNKIEMAIEISNYNELIEKLEKIKKLLQDIEDTTINIEVKKNYS